MGFVVRLGVGGWGGNIRKTVSWWVSEQRDERAWKGWRWGLQVRGLEEGGVGLVGEDGWVGLL